MNFQLSRESNLLQFMALLILDVSDNRISLQLGLSSNYAFVVRVELVVWLDQLKINKCLFSTGVGTGLGLSLTTITVTS